MSPALIFLVALAARLLHIWQIRGAPFFTLLMGDAKSYDVWAQRIAAGDWIGEEVFYQAPLYPYFVGAIYSIVGRDLFVLRICQALVGAAACVFLGLAARRLFSPRTGLVAGLALALYAPAIFFDGLVQKAGLDLFFMCVSLWLISRLMTEPEGRVHWLWLGLAMGALSLTRENAIVLVAVVAAWAFAKPDAVPASAPKRGARVRSKRPSGGRAGDAAVFALGLALVMLPVAVRNYAVGGGFYLTTSQFGPNFYIGNNPTATGTYASLRFGRGAPEYERQDAVELAEHAAGRPLTPSEVSQYWTDRALDFATTQPGAWLKLMARKALLLLNATEILDTESQETYAEWSALLRVAGTGGHFGFLVPLACIGVWGTWRERRRLWVLHALLVAYTGSVLMFYVFARYRFPLVPLLMLFAAEGVVGLRRRLGDATPRHRVAAGAVLAVVLVVTNWPLLQKSTMKAATETNLGAAFYEERRYDEAVAHYHRALQFNPDYAPAYNNMAVALAAKGQLDEAVKTYERAIALRPDYPDAHYNLANALLEKNDPEQASEHFQLALRIIPGSAEIHNNLGIALASKGRPEEAMTQFREALKADPKSAKAHRNLADVLATEGRVPEAIAYLRHAATLAPSDAAVRYDLGSVLLEAGRVEEAELEFRESLRLDPRSAEAHNNLGIALGSQGKMQDAINHFRQALVINPQFVDAQRNVRMAEGTLVR